MLEQIFLLLFLFDDVMGHTCAAGSWVSTSVSMNQYLEVLVSRASLKLKNKSLRGLAVINNVYSQ